MLSVKLPPAVSSPTCASARCELFFTLSKESALTESYAPLDSPTLILPPIIITLLEKRGAFKGSNGRRLSTVTNLGALSLSACHAFLQPH